MHIAIDGNEANVRQRVGVSRYTYELLSRFQKWAQKDCFYTIVLREKPLADMPTENEFFKYSVVPGPALWRNFFLPLSLALSSKKPDVFFSPAHYTPPHTSIPVVVTIHDLAFIHYPHDFLQKDLYKLTNWTKYAVEHSAKVIAVSEFTRQDIIKTYGLAENKVVTIHNGFASQARSDHPRKIIDQYILYVGTLQPRKNITLLIESFSSLLKTKPDIKLVIAGKKGWLYDEIFQLVQKLHIEKSVQFTGYVDDNELASLYAHASLFVHPSLYEGFGLPLLEAMSYGIPVLAARGSSLEEVGGDACVYFDPHDTIDLTSRMMDLLDNPKSGEDMIKKGYERISQFNWDECARKTLDVIQNYER